MHRLTTNRCTQTTQAVNTEFTPNTDDVEAAMTVLAPKKLVWHQEQAGIVPNWCPEDSFRDTSNNTEETTDRATVDWWKEFSAEASPNLYWQLYKLLAAYRLALQEENSAGFRYDWIIRARFDAAWIGRLPPLSMFTKNAVWLGMHYW